MDAPSQPRLPPSKTAGLGGILNNEEPPLQLRDSGFYSTADTASKHTSAASFGTAGLSPGASAGYQSSTDKTPSPVPGNVVPQTIVSPSNGTPLSVAAMVSPTTPGNRSDRPHDRPTSFEGASMPALSRRESVDSHRLNQGISDMSLSRSPYASNNQSTTSIQNTLHQQRVPRAGLETPQIHRISNGYQPSADRNPEAKTIRTAPTITGPATSHIARAAEPTKGQAWAFPEEEIQRVSHYEPSRRSSITDSIASSQFTADSRLPGGQRRLEDGSSPTSMPGYPMHHGIPHDRLNDLIGSELGGPTGAQPYSRTPELRVSHKLAERKRRTEMKELFDALRDEMPQERGSKASKWEILTKAINEHRAQKDYIKVLQTRCHQIISENEQLRRENDGLKMQLGHGPSSQQPPPPASQAQSQPTQQGPYPPDHHYASSSRTELPPLRAISSNIPPGPDSMTGVQYESPAGANGYRQDRY